MPYLYIGIIFALINGTSFPICGYLMGDIMDVLQRYPVTPLEDYKRDRNNLTYYFIILSACTIVAFTLYSYFFTLVGEGLTLRLRVDCFKKMIKMPVSWFDDPKNNPGTLASSLASDCRVVNSLTSNIIGIQINNLSAFITGMVIAFYFSWQITLVSLGMFPFMMIAGQM